MAIFSLQCWPVLCCFRKHLLMVEYAIFPSILYTFFRAHLSYNLFFSCSFTSSFYTHCYVFVQYYEWLHPAPHITANAELSPPHHMWANKSFWSQNQQKMVGKKKNVECSVKAHQQREQNSANTTYVTRHTHKRIRIGRVKQKKKLSLQIGLCSEK